MAREYAGQGFAFVFLYTREAHPGENFPAHRSMDQKLSHARAFKERFQIERPILVDDLFGAGHKLYGMLPNMTYLIGRSGKVLFRADWTDPRRSNVQSSMFKALGRVGGRGFTWRRFMRSSSAIAGIIRPRSGKD